MFKQSKSEFILIMGLNWRAIGFGFVVTVILGVLSGMTLPYTQFTLPTLSHGIVGLLGGLTAGYMTMGSARSGALNGLVATVIGAVVILILLSIAGTLVGGVLLGLSIALFGVFVLVVSGIPGVIGGYIGAWYHSRRISEDTQRAAAR